MSETPLTDAEVAQIEDASWRGGRQAWHAAINDVLAARVAAARADERAWFKEALTSDVGDLLDIEWLRENWWVRHVLAARFALTESADAQVVPCVKDCPPPGYVCHCAAQPADTDGADQ